MALFGKKKKTGTTSNVAHLRSPYLKKPSLPLSYKAGKRDKKKHSLLIPPAPLKANVKKRHPILWVLLFLLMASGVIYLIFFSSFFNLQNFEVDADGIRLENDDPIVKIIAAEKGRSIIFIDENNLINQIKTLEPNIKTIAVKKIFPSKIKVEFENYPIVANIVNVVGNVQKKFLVDTIGFLAQENNENPNLPYIKIVTTQVLPVKTVAIPADRLDYMVKAINLFEEKFGMKIVDATYLVREREVHLRTEKYFTVWLDMEKDLLPQIDKLKKALPKLDIYNAPLQYIDLRISGTESEKVIFKLRNK